MKLAENVTDINDKIYDAARPLGIGSAELARRATGWYIEDTDGLGLGRPDVEPLASETVGGDRRAHPGADLPRARLRIGGRRVFPRGAIPRVRPALGRAPEEMAAQEPGQIKEDPRDFALWKGSKPHEDTWWDSPWGRGRPGLAHRVLGDGREAPGRELRHPRRRARPALSPSRERARAVPRRRARRSPAPGCTTA